MSVKTQEVKAKTQELLREAERLKAQASKAGSNARPLDNAPHVTTGPVYQDSKRFSITNALVNGIVGKGTENAKFEMDVLERFKKAIIKTNSLPPGASASGYWLPMNWDMLGEEVNATEDCKYVKSVFAASGEQTTFDPDEYQWLMRKGIIMKTQSAYTDTLGGTMIAPPTMGPVIPLIRPQSAVLAAGAQQFPLGPQGRHVRPRITAAPSVMAVAESQDAPESDLTTDEMVLTAKKIAGMARVSEEATLFSSGTIDTVTKAELDRSLGLKMDAYAFYGTGGTSIPAGILSSVYSSAIINVASSYPSALGVGANGNTLLPQYGDLFPALIEERSFALDSANGCWIMRPGAYASAVARRADAVVSGDGSGPKVDILRRFDEAGPNTWCGRKVVKTTNIRGDRTKGSGTNLSDSFFGIWSYCIVATYGAVQFNQGMDGNTFKRSQYLVKGTMYGDIGFEYPGAFLYYGDLIGATDQI